MKKRSSEILQKLALNGKSFQYYIDNFTDKYEVSERTIRNDIEEINDLLKKLNMPLITIKSNGSIIISNEIDFQLINNNLKHIDLYNYKMSSEERRYFITVLMLTEEKFLKINDLSNMLYVSRVTIINDIAKIKEFLQNYNMSLKSGSYGEKILYDEESARLLLVDMLKKNLDNFNLENVFFNIIVKTIDTNFHMDTITQLIQNFEKKMDLSFTNEGFKLLLFYLFIALNRMEPNPIVNKINLESINKSKLNFAQKIYEQISYQLNIPIKENEIEFLGHYIEENHILPLSLNIDDYSELYNMVIKFLLAISKELNYNLQNDYTLFEFLVMHIKAMIDRLANGKKEKNPYLQLIKNEYTNIYRLIQKNMYIIEEYLSRKINEDEISYITMHICAAIERKSTNLPQLNVAIACPGSMATGHLLAAQIQKYFHFNIIGIFAASHIIETKDMNIDFIISTVEIYNVNWHVIRVNPIPNMEDINHIQLVAFKIRAQKNKNNVDIKSKLIKELNETFLLAKKQGNLINFVQDTKKLFEKYNLFDKEPQYLYKILKPELISLGAQAKNWQEAVAIGVHPLVKYEYCKQEYTEEIIANVNKNGPYFVIQKGAALAHAHPKEYVSKVGISLTIFNKGVYFGNEINDPVYLLFCFCADDSNNYLNMLKNLITLSKNKNLFQTLFDVKNNYEAYEIIKKEEISLDIP